MIRKAAPAIALLAVMLLPSSSAALGLGNIQVKSALNERLNARISLRSLTGDDAESMRVVLGTPQQFAQAGLERPFNLSDLSFAVVKGPSDRGHIAVTSSKPVNEPFLNFLIEVTWPRGRAVKEFTVLLDPPVYGAKIAAQTKRQPDTASTTAASRREPPRARAARQPTRRSSARAGSGDGRSYAVRPNDTLWSIARRNRPSSRISVNQMMLSIQSANPGAFVNGNINRLRAGSVLRIPTAEAVGGQSQAQAMAEVKRQDQEWRQGRQPDRARTAAAPPPSEQPTESPTPPAAPAIAETSEPESVESQTEPATGEQTATASAESEQPGPVSAESEPSESEPPVIPEPRTDQAAVATPSDSSTPAMPGAGSATAAEPESTSVEEQPAEPPAASSDEAAQAAAAGSADPDVASAGDTDARREGDPDVPGSDSAAADGTLTLVAPDESGAAGEGDRDGLSEQVKALQNELRLAAEEADSQRRQSAGLEQRLAQVETLVQDLQRLVELKDDAITELQNQLAQAESALAEKTAQTASTDETAAASTAPPTGENRTSAQNGQPTTDQAKGQDKAQAASQPKAEPEVKSGTQATGKKAAPPPSFLDTIEDTIGFDPIIAAAGIGGVLLVSIGGFALARRRRAAAEDDSALVAQMAEAAEGAAGGQVEQAAEFAADGAVQTPPDPGSGTDVLGDGRGAAQVAGMAVAGAVAAGAVAAGADRSGETTDPDQTEDDPSTDDDPLAEVNVYLAYESYDHAESVVRRAIEDHPERPEYRLRLLEVFRAAKNPVAFQAAAMQLQSAVGDDSPMLAQAKAWWEELAPGTVLFDETADLSAGGLDFELTDTRDSGVGGDDQTRPTEGVDFDLGFDAPLDEPTAIEPPEVDLDFDLGMVDMGPDSVEVDTGLEPPAGPTESTRPDDQGLDFDLGYPSESESTTGEGSLPALDFDLSDPQDLPSPASSDDDSEAGRLDLDLGPRSDDEAFDYEGALDLDLGTLDVGAEHSPPSAPDFAVEPGELVERAVDSSGTSDTSDTSDTANLLGDGLSLEDTALTVLDADFGEADLDPIEFDLGEDTGLPETGPSEFAPEATASWETTTFDSLELEIGDFELSELGDAAPEAEELGLAEGGNDLLIEGLSELGSDAAELDTRGLASASDGAGTEDDASGTADQSTQEPAATAGSGLPTLEVEEQGVSQAALGDLDRELLDFEIDSAAPVPTVDVPPHSAPTEFPDRLEDLDLDLDLSFGEEEAAAASLAEAEEERPELSTTDPGELDFDLSFDDSTREIPGFADDADAVGTVKLRSEDPAGGDAEDDDLGLELDGELGVDTEFQDIFAVGEGDADGLDLELVPGPDSPEGGSGSALGQAGTLSDDDISGATTEDDALTVGGAAQDRADNLQTKLDMAQTHLDIEDPEGARRLLDDVLANGSAAQQEIARAMLAKLS